MHNKKPANFAGFHHRWIWLVEAIRDPSYPPNNMTDTHTKENRKLPEFTARTLCNNKGFEIKNAVW